jgi:hypothetical protein
MPPDDILDKLNDLIVQAARDRSQYYVKAAAYEAHISDLGAENERLRAAIQSRIATAIAEERERCATIALEQRCERGTPRDAACVAIAEKIRAHDGKMT